MQGKNEGDLARKRELSRVFRDSILGASDEELKDALDQEGLDRQELVRRGRSVIDRALAQARGGDSAKPTVAQAPADFEDLHKGLGVCIQLLRRKKRISEEELAERARVPVEEVRRIEFDPTYTPRPRTLFQLEDFFRLKPRSLGVLAGAWRVEEGEALREHVRRFAALSSSMDKLTRDEKRLLAEFVELLGNYVK